jgi:hypothetical protein
VSRAESGALPYFQLATLTPTFHFPSKSQVAYYYFNQKGLDKLFVPPPMQASLRRVMFHRSTSTYTPRSHPLPGLLSRHMLGHLTKDVIETVHRIRYRLWSFLCHASQPSIYSMAFATSHHHARGNLFTCFLTAITAILGKRVKVLADSDMILKNLIYAAGSPESRGLRDSRRRIFAGSGGFHNKLHHVWV